MNRLFLALIISLLTLVSFVHADNKAKVENGQWLKKLEDAQAVAKELDRNIYLLFTGSDWCPFCVKLQKGIFDDPYFKEYAKKNLVLVYIDFPRRTELPYNVAKYNRSLANKYGIPGLPTVVLTDAGGNALNTDSGYDGEKAKDHIERFITPKSK